MRRPVLAALVLAALPLLGGCGPRCVEDLDLDCAPLYTDLSFDAVWTQTLQPRCAPGGASCHEPEGAAGGLVLDPIDAAWTALVEPADAEPRVLPGDAACSSLVVRVEHADPGQQMPPGAPLSEAERCVLRRWVAGGALR